LANLDAAAFVAAVEEAPACMGDDWSANYVAAMVETAAHLKHVEAPAWVHAIRPLARPFFASDGPPLRLHRLLTSPLAFRRRNIERLLRVLDAELARGGVKGEIYLVGGAVMCLAYGARMATTDLDGAFRAATLVRAAAARVTLASGLPDSWLYDAVKRFFGDRGTLLSCLALPNLNVFVADPAYLLAMKCLSARIGVEFHDVDDIRFLIRWLNIPTVAEAKTTLAHYYPLERYPRKMMYLFEELLPRVP
jgi:hypothetical protein